MMMCIGRQMWENVRAIRRDINGVGADACWMDGKKRNVGFRCGRLSVQDCLLCGVQDAPCFQAVWNQSGVKTTLNFFFSFAFGGFFLFFFVFV